MSYNKSKNELTNKKISEKDKAKEKYNKKIGDIKFNRGVNFSIEYLKTDDINYYIIVKSIIVLIQLSLKLMMILNLKQQI